MAGAQFTVDRKDFDNTLRIYRTWSSKDPAEIVNRKALRMMISAVKETPKSTKAQIRKDLMAIGRKGAPIAAMLVNKLRAAEGLKGLYGTAMKTAIAELIKDRKVSTLKAGYAEGIRALIPYVNANANEPASVRGQGKGRGYGKPARPGGWNAIAEFANLIGAKWDTRDTATPKAIPALQKAFDLEVADMRIYIEDKMRKSAQKAGIRTN